MVLNSSSSKPRGLVHLLVEPDHVGDIVLAEVGKIELGGVEGIACKRDKQDELYCPAVAIRALVDFTLIGD